MPVTVAVVGSGSLARAICNAAASRFSVEAELVVLARSEAKAAETCVVANTRAALSGAPVRFRPLVADLSSARDVAAALSPVAPAVVVTCASHQSPWERLHSPSRWTALVEEAGFGITLPLQAAVPIAVATALARVAPSALLVNGSFPDAVNPLLRALDLPVLCGIGNASTLAAGLQSALGLPDQARLLLLAHHRHLHAPSDPADEACAWLDERPIPAMGQLLAAQRAVSRPELNAIAAQAAAQLLDALTSGGELETSLPGPLGLPGGYPIRIESRRMELRLPLDVTREQAVAWNQRSSLRDGVLVEEDGEVSFPRAVALRLRRYLPELADGFHARDTLAACARLLELRARLRAGSPPARPRPLRRRSRPGRDRAPVLAAQSTTKEEP
jgi:hypothetical protein